MGDPCQGNMMMLRILATDTKDWLRHKSQGWPDNGNSNNGGPMMITKKFLFLSFLLDSYSVKELSFYQLVGAKRQCRICTNLLPETVWHFDSQPIS